MIGRLIHGAIVVLATLFALVLVAAFFLALVEPENTGDPTDAPSSGRPYPEGSHR